MTECLRIAPEVELGKNAAASNSITPKGLYPMAATAMAAENPAKVTHYILQQSRIR
jgi:hypothetical protein